MLSHLGIAFMRLLGYLPLTWLRAIGVVLGLLLYVLVVPRRRVVHTNLRLCFPQQSSTSIRRTAIGTFVRFTQAWLDRAWLWHGSPELIRRRVTLTGAVNELHGNAPTVMFAPHFVGLDSIWMILTVDKLRQFTTIYTNQSNPIMDAWILAGRLRFGNGRLFGRIDGVKTIVAALRAGEPLILLPDMSFGVEDSVFVPFYGVPTATVPSLSRFARLGRAKVVPIFSRMTRTGYTVEVLPAWTDFPTADLVADTALMNLRLQSYIETMPDQYFWVHKRFKDRPPGAPPVY
ncbi:MAG: lipid A biosynthesis acyltransferase [Rhodoferax sp.]|nr:lipid A biosynthesis acyltransferase [Rhodoferax sp.]MBP9684824.1 lipid A biosynthesis acyltransferase [Rhodoferax sp.]